MEVIVNARVHGRVGNMLERFASAQTASVGVTGDTSQKWVYEEMQKLPRDNEFQRPLVLSALLEGKSSTAQRE